MRIVGIDPGAEHVGLVHIEIARPNARPRLLDHDTVERARPAHAEYLPVPLDFLEDIHKVVRAWAPDLLGVEDITPPVQAKNRAARNPGPVFAAAIVAGYCCSFLPIARVVQVAPGHNGAAALGTYPDALVSSHERKFLHWQITPGDNSGRLRHERSAYDVARLAERQRRALHKELGTP